MNKSSNIGLGTIFLISALAVSMVLLGFFVYNLISESTEKENCLKSCNSHNLSELPKSAESLGKSHFCSDMCIGGVANRYG